jgi:hypothetical protein
MAAVFGVVLAIMFIVVVAIMFGVVVATMLVIVITTIITILVATTVLIILVSIVIIWFIALSRVSDLVMMWLELWVTVKFAFDAPGKPVVQLFGSWVIWLALQDVFG